MKLNTWILVIVAIPILFSMNSCSLGVNSAITKSYPTLNPSDSVKVISLKDSSPRNAEILGTVRIYDAGSVNCGYKIVIEAAKTEARKAGGNALKITEHRPPSIWSSCHQITAIILKLNPDSLTGDSIQQAISPESGKTTQSYYVDDKKLYRSFYLSAEGGWSWRISRIDENLNSFQREYLSDLMSGYHYGVSAIYYLNRGLGIGFLYDKHISKNSVQASAIDSTGKTLYGELRDDISISLIAATVDFRTFSKSGKNSFHFKLGLGYCGYKDVGGFIKYGKIESSSFAMTYDFSYNIFLADHWYFAPSLAYRIGTLTSYDITVDNITRHVRLSSNNYEGLTRVDLSFGLRYQW